MLMTVNKTNAMLLESQELLLIPWLCTKFALKIARSLMNFKFIVLEYYFKWNDIRSPLNILVWLLQFRSTLPKCHKKAKNLNFHTFVMYVAFHLHALRGAIKKKKEKVGLCPVTGRGGSSLPVLLCKWNFPSLTRINV